MPTLWSINAFKVMVFLIKLVWVFKKSNGHIKKKKKLMLLTYIIVWFGNSCLMVKRIEVIFVKLVLDTGYYLIFWCFNCRQTKFPIESNPISSRKEDISSQGYRKHPSWIYYWNCHWWEASSGNIVFQQAKLLPCS